MRRLFGRKAKQQGNDENYITSIFLICIPHIVFRRLNGRDLQYEWDEQETCGGSKLRVFVRPEYEA
jgi:hypothetical protein